MTHCHNESGGIAPINRIFDKQLEQLSGGTINVGVIEVVKKQKLEKGLEQGLEKKSTEVVKNLIMELKLTDEQIARIAGVTVDFVRNIHKNL